jgi:hypothetical protein
MFRRATPEHITKLEPNEIFVFGSNLAGRHGAGATLQAKLAFGAVYGVGRGLAGQCYAFPTLNAFLRKRGIRDLRREVTILFTVAKLYSNLTFLVTKVGCGLAGYPEEVISELFKGPPDNVILPGGWDG